MPNLIITALTTAAESLEALVDNPTAAEVVDRAIEHGPLTPIRSEADAKRLVKIAQYLLEARTAGLR